jgi:hypothetical protein
VRVKRGTDTEFFMFLANFAAKEQRFSRKKMRLCNKLTANFRSASGLLALPLTAFSQTVLPPACPFSNLTQLLFE